MIEHGYKPDDFELQDSESQKRKARTDYTLIWQAKPGDPRNVGDDHYRLIVRIAGDQVVSFARNFKLPEDWVRRQMATGLSRVLLLANAILLVAGFVGGLLILFILRLKSGRIAWRSSAKVGAFVGLAFLLTRLNNLPLVIPQYPTDLPWNAFLLRIVIAVVVSPVFAGLIAWMVVALATSFYPDAWRIFRSQDRRIWRRDALVAAALSLAAGAGILKLSQLFSSHYHAVSSIGIDLIPGSFNAYLPGAGLFLGALLSSISLAALLALVIFVVRTGLRRRAWWLLLAVAMGMAALGPSGAHSLGEYFAGWVVAFVFVAASVVIVAVWFRDNVLAYVAAIFCSMVGSSLAALLKEPLPFFRLNGVALAILALMVLAWLFLGGNSKAVPVVPAESNLPNQ